MADMFYDVKDELNRIVNIIEARIGRTQDFRKRVIHLKAKSLSSKMSRLNQNH